MKTFKEESNVNLVIRDKNTKKDIYLTSKISKRDDKKETITIHIPTKDLKPYPIDVDVEVEVQVVEKGSIYSITTRVASRKVIGVWPMLILKVLGKTKEIQRRQSFRIKYIDSINYIKNNRNIGNGHVININGTGIKIRTNDNMEKADRLVLNFNFINLEIKKLEAIVMWKKNLINENYLYEYGVWFAQIDEKLQENIIKNIFHLQRKLLKRN
jgi:c-di-GMP-binding flagellar brake protein YcgR